MPCLKVQEEAFTLLWKKCLPFLVQQPKTFSLIFLAIEVLHLCSQLRLSLNTSKISQEYQPLDISSLPPNLRLFLNSLNGSDCPQLSPFMVYSHIVKAHRPTSTVPGDLPKKVVQKMRRCTCRPHFFYLQSNHRTSEYPIKWKVKHQIAIPKKFPTESEDDLRNIAKTPFLSKVFESFLATWLLDINKHFLDPNQCGLKGFSISHYLIILIDFIHSTPDMKSPLAILSAYIDLSKAFNRVDHSLVIQDLYDMHTPSWLLKIIVSYLSGRTMVLKCNGSQSSVNELPAGSSWQFMSSMWMTKL